VSRILEEAAQLSRAGQPFVLATVVWRRAPSSGRLGSKAIVFPDGSFHGWVGGACSLPTLLHQAREALSDGQPRLVLVSSDHEHTTAQEGVVHVPMTCASEGTVEIYLEPQTPLPHVLVVGSSPLVTTLAQLALDIGWTSTTFDGDPALGVSPESVDSRTAVVVATQGHDDENAVRAALATRAGYVGLVASRKRAESVAAALLATGVDQLELDRLRSPAGLDLGSIEHEHIAVAVLAELVALHASGGLRAEVLLTPAPVTAVDPICGMTVDVATARFTSESNGEAVYFCSAGCQRAFQSSTSV